MSGVSGVSWVSGFGGRVCVRGVRRFVCGAGGFGLLLALRPGLFPLTLGLLGGGEEEGAVHLIEGDAARVFHPNRTVLPPVDTTDGAPLYPFGVGYVDDRPDDRILRTIVLLLSTLGGVGLRGGWGGGVVVAVLGGLVGLGAGTAFVGRAVVVVGGSLGLLGRGIAPSSLSLDDWKENFRFLGAGWGGWASRLGGGGGAVVVDAPPPPPPRSPRPHPCSPTSPHPPPPTRVPHLLHPGPLRGPEVARRHPYAAHRARSLPIVETSQESKAQGWVSGHDAVEGPQGYFLGSFGVVARPPGWAWHSSR